MKKVLLIAIIILYAAGVYAQVGMPKELTCTERAFNFSFSLGTKWKISTPKMGPAEVTREELDYIPAWSLKHNEVTPETFGHPINQQNYATLSYYNIFRVTDKPKYLLPDINFSPPIVYKVLNPDFPGECLRSE
jgi:hypothetical protein